jgi:hypothetical protein
MISDDERDGIDCLYITSKKMGDHSNETLELQNRWADEELEEEESEEGSNETLQFCRYDRTCDLLSGQDLDLDDDTTSWISNHIDCFVNQSQGNESIEEVGVYPYSVDGHDYYVWDKVGQAIGNLQALEWLYIYYHDEGDSSDEDDDAVVAPVPIPDWEILARILRHVRQNVTLVISERLRTIEEVQSFARAICGHPTITGFTDSGKFPYKSLETLFSTLSTLPALESVSFGAPEVRQVDESTLAYPESLTELLRVPTLRFVRFKNFSFTPALFQAMANALMEGTAVTNLEFIHCSISAVECDLKMANGLSTNTSVSCSKVDSTFDVALIGALAVALPSNSTLRYLELELGQQNDDDLEWSPVFSALGQNTGLKSLKVDCFGLMDESLCTAMKDGLGMNEILESLELNDCQCDESSAMWCSALSFLRTNKALKFLMVTFDGNATKSSCFDALCRHIAAMLHENASLESLFIRKDGEIKIEVEEHFSLVAALQHNTTLKSLNLQSCRRDAWMTTLTHDEDKQMAALLMKNYGLESLPGINLKNRASDVDAVLRLNGAGRRYLVQDGSSISKGIEVLSRVNNDINCLLLHLSENPRLCDRSAVEK